MSFDDASVTLKYEIDISIYFFLDLFNQTSAGQMKGFIDRIARRASNSLIYLLPYLLFFSLWFFLTSDSRYLTVFLERDLYRALDWLSGTFHLYGPEMQGGGHLPGPLVYWLYALPLSINLGEPGIWLILAMIHILIGLFAIKKLRSEYGERSVLFFCVSYALFIHSHHELLKTWNASLNGSLFLLYFIYFKNSVPRKNNFVLFLEGMILLSFIQLHFTLLFLTVHRIYMLLRVHRRASQTIVFILGALTSLIPFFLFKLGYGVQPSQIYADESQVAPLRIFTEVVLIFIENINFQLLVNYLTFPQFLEDLTIILLIFINRSKLKELIPGHFERSFLVSSFIIFTPFLSVYTSDRYTTGFITVLIYLCSILVGSFQNKGYVLSFLVLLFWPILNHSWFLSSIPLSSSSVILLVLAIVTLLFFVSHLQLPNRSKAIIAFLLILGFGTKTLGYRKIGISGDRFLKARELDFITSLLHKWNVGSLSQIQDRIYIVDQGKVSAFRSYYSMAKTSDSSPDVILIIRGAYNLPKLPLEILPHEKFVEVISPFKNKMDSTLFEIIKNQELLLTKVKYNQRDLLVAQLSYKSDSSYKGWNFNNKGRNLYYGFSEGQLKELKCTQKNLLPLSESHFLELCIEAKDQQLDIQLDSQATSFTDVFLSPTFSAAIIGPRIVYQCGGQTHSTLLADSIGGATGLWNTKVHLPYFQSYQLTPLRRVIRLKCNPEQLTLTYRDIITFRVKESRYLHSGSGAQVLNL